MQASTAGPADGTPSARVIIDDHEISQAACRALRAEGIDVTADLRDSDQALTAAPRSAQTWRSST